MQLPLQQLAWLVSQQQSRLIICGTGTAGGVAQHAAMALQKMLQLQVFEVNGSRVPNTQSISTTPRPVCVYPPLN